MRVEILERNGSQVIVRNKKGEVWLTRRKKIRHDSRRRKLTRGCSVRFIPIKRIPQKGDWLFTCKLEPVQFLHDIERDLKGYTRSAFTDEEWEEFKKDDFVTLEGSHHSKKYCSLRLISDEYAAFFNTHKLWELFELNNEDFDLYEEAVKQVCEAFKIKYEGI